ncbi:branched-chain amino acid transporter AzlD [Acetobacterium fimetarium]|uniref:Branched-chain amino acid transporter AzlD n=1 Tax=Acetobacterium fimetarium TaxID=52691 RepID=A0ABR6WQX2_9FIRM|nr:AzlD domain-containing protein [Acetobacterium fimetarium]MBC3803031.1 branched-chain amino acid transporter AzlD [Acetobacterium fimetarium]
MIIDFSDAAVTLIVVSLMTGLTRAIPYLLFGGKKEIPETVVYLGNMLPASIMIILVVYCLRNIDFSAFPFGLAEFLSVALVIVVQYLKKNSLLSIILGTACYMLLIRTIF